MKQFIKKYRHASLLLYAFIYLPWFIYLEKTVTTHFHVIETKIDRYIPFVEYFIVPYLLWFAYIAVTALYFFFFASKREYYQFGIFLITGMTVFLIISSVFPNGQVLRPFVFERENIFVKMVETLYRADTPTNIFPSIHVYNSIGAHIAICNNQKLREKKWVIWSSGTLMTLIILSTMFLKQHSIIDAIGAVIMAYIVYALVYKLEGALESRKVRHGLTT